MEYIQLCFLLVASVSVSAFLTPFLRRIALENGLVDLPSERKIHRQVIPRIGGVAIAMSFFSAVVFGYSLFQKSLPISLAPLAGLAIGGVFILLVGLLDDINSKGLEASKKLIGQIAAALALIPFGFVVEFLDIPFIGTVHLNTPVGLVLTVLWMVAITNAVNLTDGMDGLCSGLAMIAAATLAVLAIVSGKLLMTIILVTLLGSTLGFLFHNWHPAKIFMGDCGAMFLGYILAAVSIEVAFKNGAAGSHSAAGSIVPALVFGLPILDTTVAIARRLWNRRPIFSADKEHIHHRLLDRGLSVRQTLLVLYGVSIVFGITALFITTLRSSIAVGIAAAVVGAAFFGMMRLKKKKRVEITPVVAAESKRAFSGR